MRGGLYIQPTNPPKLEGKVCIDFSGGKRQSVASFRLSDACKKGALRLSALNLRSRLPPYGACRKLSWIKGSEVLMK